MIFDRRPEIIEALTSLTTFDWPTERSLYNEVTRFNRSFNFMVEHLLRTEDLSALHRTNWKGFANVLRVREQFEGVGDQLVPWACHDAGRPQFWDTLLDVLPVAIEEMRRFPSPIERLTTIDYDLPIKYLGDDFPLRASPEEYSREDRYDDGSSVHFRHWWDLRTKTVEIFRYHGFSYPEDKSDGGCHFYMTEDQLNDLLYVNAGVCKPDALDTFVLIDQWRLYLSHPLWALLISIDDANAILVTSEGLQLIGPALRGITNTKTLFDVIPSIVEP